MQDSIFREYDIRGKIGSELVIADMYDLARSIAYYFTQKNPHVKRVALGMDGRLSSPAIKEEVVNGLLASGLEVVFIGTCPSPVLYFALHTLAVDAGLMITASHNPADYNGLKICLGTQSIWGQGIQEIRKIYREKKFLNSDQQGAYHEHPVIPSYISWMKDHFPDLINMPLAAVVDCGNGAGATVMPALIAAMQWQHVKLLCAEVDGTYPHHEADPVVEKNMVHVKDALVATDAQLGIGLDGDADRMAAMTKSGFLVPGDQLLAIYAQELLKEYPESAIVFDVKASSGLIELLAKWHAKPIMSPCGHAIIKSRMEKEDARLGGELSCHFFFDDHYFGYDDGIYAMLRLFEIVIKTGKSLDELLRVFPKKYSSAEMRIACAQEQKQVIIDAVKSFFSAKPNAHLITIDGVRVSLPYGWFLIRASNTQPVLSMRFEGNTAADLKRIKEEIVPIVRHYYDEAVLIKEFGI